MGKKLIFLTLSIIIALTFSADAQFILSTDCEPYGSISIRNEPAADNLPVVAFINGSEVASCLTNGGQYSMIIPMDDPETPEVDGWQAGNNIVIKISGIEATPSFSAQSGRLRKDLSITTLDVTLDTWGKIKALFK